MHSKDDQPPQSRTTRRYRQPQNTAIDSIINPSGLSYIRSSNGREVIEYTDPQRLKGPYFPRSRRTARLSYSNPQTAYNSNREEPYFTGRQRRRPLSHPYPYASHHAEAPRLAAPSQHPRDFGVYATPTPYQPNTYAGPTTINPSQSTAHPSHSTSLLSHTTNFPTPPFNYSSLSPTYTLGTATRLPPSTIYREPPSGTYSSASPGHSVHPSGTHASPTLSYNAPSSASHLFSSTDYHESPSRTYSSPTMNYHRPSLASHLFSSTDYDDSPSGTSLSPSTNWPAPASGSHLLNPDATLLSHPPQDSQMAAWNPLSSPGARRASPRPQPPSFYDPDLSGYAPLDGKNPQSFRDTSLPSVQISEAIIEVVTRLGITIGQTAPTSCRATYL